MNKLSLLAGAAIGVMLTAGIAQLQAQGPAPAPASAATTRPAVFVITEQTFIDEKKYNDEYAPKVLKTIKDHGGRFIVRTAEVTSLQGDPGPKRLVIIGFESMDEVKKWQSSKDYTDLKPLRDQVLKIRQFAVNTCANPQGAKPGQTQCP
jgi:uncharacterized protein (DUF1330 family)